MDLTSFNWLDSRASNKTAGNKSGKTGQLGIAALSRGATPGISNSTREIVNGLLLDKVQQVRYMHIAFGSISIAFVFYIILRIWYDSWRASQLSVPLRRRRFDFLWNLHPAESFPLLLGLFILIQQFSFVAIQAKALKSVFIQDCRVSSQVVFTQIFVVGYIHFIFGLEMTIRSLRRTRFTPRPKYTTAVCTVIVLIMCILTWLSTRLRMPRNTCFGDLIWRSIRSAPLGVVICTFLIPSFIIMAAIIALQLRRTVNVEPDERIAGTRMVYYLLLSAVLYIMVLPFWVQAMLSAFDSDLSSSRVAEFVLFISGAVIAFTHMFLRANAARTALKPSETPWQERRGFRFFGPSDLELMHISAPIMKQEYRPDEKVSDVWSSQRANTKDGTPNASSVAPDFIFPVSLTKATTKATTKVPSWPFTAEPLPPPKDQPLRSSMAPKVATTAKKASNHQRQAGYSLFPGSDDLRLPATVYTPGAQPKSSTNAFAPGYVNPFAGTSPVASDDQAFGTLQPPPRAPWKLGHRRGSSTDSMATVQIGIRFSTAPAALAASGIAGNSLTQPAQPSVRGVIDSISSEGTLPLPSQGSPTSGRLDGPFDPNFSTATPHGNSSPMSEYAWLDIANSPSPIDSPRQTIPRATAESNRSEIANLERSGSIGRKDSVRSRARYQSPPTPDNTSKNTGFF